MSHSPAAAETCSHDDILDCEHFHEWLVKGLEAWKDEHRDLPWQALADALDVAPSTITRIRQRKRRLPRESLPHVARLFGLDAVQSSIMTRLYDLNYANAPGDAARIEWLGSVRFQDGHPHPAGYLDHWVNVAIREMQALPDAPALDDIAAYQRRLRPTVDDEHVAHALSLLRSRKLKARALYVESHRGPDADRDYHRQLGELVVDAANVPKVQRHLTSYTDAVSVETFQAVQREIQACMERIVAICDSAPADEKRHVVQISMQLFPLTTVAADEVLRRG